MAKGCPPYGVKNFPEIGFKLGIVKSIYFGSLLPVIMKSCTGIHSGIILMQHACSYANAQCGRLPKRFELRPNSSLQAGAVAEQTCLVATTHHFVADGCGLQVAGVFRLTAPVLAVAGFMAIALG